MKKTALEFQKSATRESCGDDTEKPTFELVNGGRTEYAPSRLSPARISLSDLEDYGKDWINDALCMRQSPATITGKREALARLTWFLKHINSPHFGPRELTRFVAYIAIGHEETEGRWGNPRLKSPASDRTVEAYYNYIRGFCRWMVSDPYIPLEIDLSVGVRVPKSKSELIEPFSDEQLKALLTAADRSKHNKRDRAILLFMLDTGVRASELCGLTWGDVQLYPNYGQARVLGKGKKERKVNFSRVAARALWKYSQESPRTAQAPVFLSDRGINGGGALTRSGLLQLFDRLGTEADLTGVRCSPHTMRHTFAIKFLRRGGQAFSLQIMLGHTDLKMTQKYCKIAEADIDAQHAEFSPADGLK
ncbi:tyrosine recombinase XerD [Abditibacteriota bacterium]|nr:tyrosine recombinase XerD [Abditibacteriota bacterium]